jgi:hypothetical protein
MLATAHDLPMNPSYTKTLTPVVAVLGRAGRVAGLAGHLPTGWCVRVADGLADVRPGEIVLIAGATERDVTTARKRLPGHTSVVALVDMDAPAETVADVLTAGADVCVRGGTPAILASHLVACRRRQLTDRWSTLNHNLTAS